MDPLRHPDLIEVSRTLRHQIDAVLIAEQQAARATMRRRRTIRDRLLEAEDRGETIEVCLTTGARLSGILVAVGADHLLVASPPTETYVHLDHVTSCTFRS